MSSETFVIATYSRTATVGSDGEVAGWILLLLATDAGVLANAATAKASATPFLLAASSPTCCSAASVR